MGKGVYDVKQPTFTDIEKAHRYQAEGEDFEAIGDDKEAFRCFIYSATYAHPRGLAARNRLALKLSSEELHEEGKQLFFEHYLDATKNNPVSCHIIGLLYDKGWGFDQDFGKAVEYYARAARQGFVMSVYNLAVFTANGLGLPKNLEEALRLYFIAAEGGVASAMNNIGTFYVSGSGVNQDHKAANQWFLRAANNDDAVAQSNLGYRMFFGIGGPSDREEGIRLLKKSVEVDYDDGYYKLGICYSDRIAAGDLYSPLEAAHYLMRATKFPGARAKAQELLHAVARNLPQGWRKQVESRIEREDAEKECKRKARAIKKYVDELGALFESS